MLSSEDEIWNSNDEREEDVDLQAHCDENPDEVEANVQWLQEAEFFARFAA